MGVTPIIWPASGRVELVDSAKLSAMQSIGWRLLDSDGDGQPDPITPEQTTNADALNRIAATLGDAAVRPVHITVVSDSIGWGVGSDGLTSEAYSGGYDAAQQERYRSTSWPAQLAKLLNNNGQIARGYAGPGLAGVRGWNYPTTTGGTVAQSANIGPFGNHTNAQRGGVTLANGAWVEYSAAELGAFTDLSVEFFGSDAGVSGGAEPTVIVDGATVYTQDGANDPAGYLNRITITGLANTAHTVRIANNRASRTVYLAGITATLPSGVVVHRVGSPGATSGDAIAAPGVPQRDRIIAATVKPGLTDLLVLALGTNDYGNQVDPAAYAANLLLLGQPVLAAGGSVLIFGPTPRSTAVAGSYAEADYDAAAAAVAAANGMAFLSARSIMRTRAFADAAGLFSGSGTVHPSRSGHGLYARTIAAAIRRLPSGASSAALPAPPAVTSLTVAAVTATTATLKWLHTTGAARYQIEYKAAASGVWLTGPTTDQLGATVTGLTTATAYDFRITPSNTAGAGAASRTVKATTP